MKMPVNPSTLGPSEIVMSDADKRKKEVARMRDLAILGAMMGTPATKGVSEILTEEVQSATKPGSGRKSLGSGFVMNDDGTVERIPEYAAWESARDEEWDRREARRLGMSLERYRAQQGIALDKPTVSLQPTEGGVVPVTTTPGGRVDVGATVPIEPRPSGEVAAKRQEAARLAAEARTLAGMAAETPQAFDPAKSIAVTGLSKIPGIGTGVANYAQSKMFSPEAAGVRESGRLWENDLSNLAAGMNVTGYELEQRDAWSPFAPGIGPEEAARRITKIEKKFAEKADPSLVEKRPATSQPESAANPRKTIDGVTYEKRGGKWYEVD